MTEATLVLILAIVGGVLGGIDVIRTRARSLTAWGVVLLALAVVVIVA